MARRIVLAILGLLVGTTVSAQQVTIQHGSTLSDLINNLYGGNGINLARTGHEAHFGETGDFQNFTRTLQAVLQSRTFFPIPSAVGLVSYRFNDATGTYERVEGSMGPILAERGSTTGRGNLNVSMTYTFADYKTVNGNDNTELVLHHCLLPECVSNIASPYLQDTIHVLVHFRLKSQALALSAIYGVSDRFDIGVVVPYIRNDLQVFSHAQLVPGPKSTPPDPHAFDPTIETPDQAGTGTAVGVGDLVARAKFRLMPRAGFDSALLADLSLPTGDKANFLGTGKTKLKVTYIASMKIHSFTPHVNAGYELRFGETKLDIFDYRIGTEMMASPKLTIATDLIGVFRPHASTLFRSPVLGDQQLVGHSEIDGVLGGKWKMSSTRAFLFNLLAPLNSSGIRPSFVATVGIQMTP